MEEVGGSRVRGKDMPCLDTGSLGASNSSDSPTSETSTGPNIQVEVRHRELLEEVGGVRVRGKDMPCPGSLGTSNSSDLPTSETSTGPNIQVEVRQGNYWREWGGRVRWKDMPCLDTGSLGASNSSDSPTSETSTGPNIQVEVRQENYWRKWGEVGSEGRTCRAWTRGAWGPATVQIRPPARPAQDLTFRWR